MENNINFDAGFKSGYIGLIGRTNVGKSTLINKILNKNVVITSDKAQTTRSRVNCIYNTDKVQAIFVDCPGFFKPRNLLGEKLNGIIYEVLGDVDTIALMVDIFGGIGPGDRFVFEQIRKRRNPKFLVLNKIDLFKEPEKGLIKERADEIVREFDFFDDVIPISAFTGENIDLLLSRFFATLPEGPKYFPDGIITDMPVDKLIAEIVREKLANNLFEELPHSVNVEVINREKKTTKTGKVLEKIECTIYVEKKSHKSIIIGSSGAMIKKIGELSRMEIEEILETKVYLQLWVKVMENWTRNSAYLDRLGY